MAEGTRSLAMIPVAVALLLAPATARAETLLYSFYGRSGANPVSHIYYDKSTGVLYGTTQGGGKHPYGTVFALAKVNGSWQETLLHNFLTGEGTYPASGVYMDKSGALYGTTERGGINKNGVIYRLAKSGGVWTYQVLHSFAGGSGDGSFPLAGLIQDPATGIFYGTTYSGGSQNCGVVYQLSLSGQTWTEAVVADLGGSQGCNSVAALREESPGILYGTTEYGGQYGYGTVFELTQNNGVWSENVLHDFASGSDGAYAGALDMDSAGNIFGVTYEGGSQNFGTVFELVQNGGSWTETVLHSFARPIRADGLDPVGLRVDSATGALYGTTESGGKYDVGAVFELTQNNGVWSEALLHSFTGTPYDGANPHAGPAVDPKSRTLYGTTDNGGTYNAGAVYKLEF